MKRITEDDKKIITEKLKNIKLDLNNIPDILKINAKVSYRPEKEYDNTSYKVYKFIDIENIEIYLTPTTRLDSAEKKYKLAKPLHQYLNPEDDEQLELHMQFIELIKNMDLDELNEIDEMQKQFKKSIPYEIKYKNNFNWDIYYSEIEDKYFMLCSTKETHFETLFYIIKKKIENQNKKIKDLIYVPVNNMQLEYDYLKRTEISDLENYLWYFTGNWPTIYEVQDQNNNKTLQIIGKTPVYEKVKSIYKIVFNNKEETQKQFKLIKALFILQSNMEQEYNIITAVNEIGELNFYYNHNKITYDTLTTFISNEINRKKDKFETINKQIILETEKWLLLKKTLQKQNIEYLNKEKQIVTFLECKKSFFGKVSYFFKGKKKKIKKDVIQEDSKQEDKQELIEEFKLEEKNIYTIEDLLKIGKHLENKEKEYKDKLMDITALENKKENLEKKIKNATLYINEIESHKKSIFDFWKFTNKDESNLLNEGKNDLNQEKHNKIKRAFSYEEDIEDFAIEIDRKQKNILSPKECDAIFAISKDIDSFNIVSKDKILKKDENYIEKTLKAKKEQYEKDYEKIKEKDFDIFGNIVEDKTKIKTLKNHKHREIEKDEYKILDIHVDTALEQYQDVIKHYNKILEESYDKMVCPSDISVYKLSDKTIEDEKWIIMQLNPKVEILKSKTEEEKVILNRINIKENMNALFYSNIVYYDNMNNTLPDGMDIKEEVLLDLKRYELKLISRKDFNINLLNTDYKNIIKKIEVYEYDITEKGSRNDK